jgi:DNA helicase-2/ATP-dependent DNA helicase PcrA
MPIDEILERELTPAQRNAAIDESQEILCLACAGSGKSRTLAYRIARLIAEGESPESIVAFTFTEKAAESIKRRVAQALSAVGIEPEVMGAMYIGTIHSYCQHLLGQIDAVYRQFDVLDDNRLKLYLISRYAELGLHNLRPRARGRSYFDTIKQISEAWKIINDEMINIDQIQDYDEVLGRTLELLRDCLRRDQFIDFSLMIRNVVDALVNEDMSAEQAINQVQHLMVDEYQDVSPCQEELIRLISNQAETLFVVGDDDQSIYSWRGADVNNILTFEERYPDAARHTLSDNFRSTPLIVEISDAFVSAELGPSRTEKNPRAEYDTTPNDVRVLWFNTREDEAEWVAERILALLSTEYIEIDGVSRGLTPADFAILMQSTRQEEQNGSPRHSAFTDALRDDGIPYSLESGGGPFERPQVSVLRSTLELLRGGSPDRTSVRSHFNDFIRPSYPSADFNRLVRVLTNWGRQIHTPPGGARRRVYPQQLIYELLEVFGLGRTYLPDEVMRDIGLFSRMIQDVEAVYMSVDSASRFRDILNFLGNPAETGYDVSTDDILLRPDAVTVSTVHKVKGLEYPVVFVVDVENQRFPKRRRAYDGWLPNEVIQPALNRGAYQSNDEEQARLFYTAITRAETYLYVTGAERLPGGASRRIHSRYANRLTHDDISTVPTGIPEGLVQTDAQRRIDETTLPTSFSEIRYYLKCPMDYRLRQGFGFSPPIPDMFGFGKTVHTAVGKLHEQFTDEAPDNDEAEEVAIDVFHLKHVPQSRNPEENPGPYERARDKTVEILQNYAESYADDFSRRREVEARFEIPARDSVISGAIDLLLHEDENGNVLDAEVIDFKAIEGGEAPEENTDLDWTELSLQVQLYAKAAQEVLDENARTGSVHLLKDDQRVEVPINNEAVQAAINNIEWAVQGILSGDYPMRPHEDKCSNCDFNPICPKIAQNFNFTVEPPPRIHTPSGLEYARSFSLYEE